MHQTCFFFPAARGLTCKAYKRFKESAVVFFLWFCSFPGWSTLRGKAFLRFHRSIFVESLVRACRNWRPSDWKQKNTHPGPANPSGLIVSFFQIPFEDFEASPNAALHLLYCCDWIYFCVQIRSTMFSMSVVQPNWSKLCNDQGHCRDWSWDWGLGSRVDSTSRAVVSFRDDYIDSE